MKLKINQYSFLKSKRKLNFCPMHFTKTSIKANDEQMLWVYENTIGRFSIYKDSYEEDQPDLFSLRERRKNLAFEDPLEAILCELTWS